MLPQFVIEKNLWDDGPRDARRHNDLVGAEGLGVQIGPNALAHLQAEALVRAVVQPEARHLDAVKRFKPMDVGLGQMGHTVGLGINVDVRRDACPRHDDGGTGELRFRQERTLSWRLGHGAI
ncbi:MAG: hypothetical protein CMF70_06720 [Magnetovibrio sp.]|nr:hypothetical protein [Magnetovibrio sp.]